MSFSIEHPKVPRGVEMASEDFARLIEGFGRFRDGPYREQRRRYDTLAAGQRPSIMVIACCDSRVDPTTIFDAHPGEIFVLRHIAALVPPCERDGKHHGASAAIEFAVTQLAVEHIVVLGHGRCGGIQASLSGCFDHAPEGEGGFIHHWMEMIGPARDRILAAATDQPNMDAQRALEHAAIQISIDNLRTFPFVKVKENAGSLHLHGAFFDICEGELQLLEPQSEMFEPVGIPEIECAVAA
jgi:carbonic anhydrase